jgi:vacuolar protein sorting-associated protein 54
VFRSYVSQVGTIYAAFQRSKENDEDPNSQLFRRDKAAGSDFTDMLEQGLRKTKKSNYASSIISLTSPRRESFPSSPVESPAVKRRASATSVRRAQPAATPLTTIPGVYFDQDFHLENPRTFDVVSERSDVLPPEPGTPGGDRRLANGAGQPGLSRKALHHNAMLQEKISWYMDTIEVHLIASISTASSSFFAALGSLRELHAEASESVKKIQVLRGDLSQLDKDMAVGGLNVVSMKRRRENLRRLGAATEQLRMVVEGVSRCEGMVDDGNLEEAVDAVEGLEKLIAGEEEALRLSADRPFSAPELIDLRGVKALEGVNQGLGLLRYRIGKGFESRFLETLLGDLRQHLKRVPERETLERWGALMLRSRGNHIRNPSVLPAYLNLDDSLRKSLLADLNGLGRSKFIAQAANSYREAALREIKALIRKHLPSSTDDDNESVMSASTSATANRRLTQQEKSSILARNLRDLDAEAAEDLFVKIYTGVGETLRRLATQVKVLLDVTSGISSPPPSGSFKSPPRSPSMPTLNGYLNHDPPQEESPLEAIDLSSLLGQAVDVAQTQITKILRVRSEQSSQLSLSRFLRYFTLNRLFADECELVSQRSGTALKTVVNNQIKDFVVYMNDDERQHLMQCMESDQWAAKDFAEGETESLTRVLQGSHSGVDAWAKLGRVWEDMNEAELDLPTKGNGEANGTAKDAKTRSATVDEEKFILPNSAIAVLKGVERYEAFIAVIPSMTQELSSNLLEYLKLFNSRSSQLILGAGATKVAGLKNITTKHLALASQSLSFIIAIIPHIREFVRRHLSSAPSASGLLPQFDNVKRLYQEHQAGIHDKLAEIMSGRSATHVRAMKQVEWEVPSKGVNAYMETLTKETLILHRALSKHLPESTVMMIMDPVFNAYKDQWAQAYQDIPLKNEVARER